MKDYTKGLSRYLGLPMLIFYDTGMILGAGIYSIIGKATAQTGNKLWRGFVLAGISAAPNNAIAIPTRTRIE